MKKINKNIRGYKNEIKCAKCNKLFNLCICDKGKMKTKNISKFEESYKKVLENLPTNARYESYKYMWNLCKKEVLNILKENSYPKNRNLSIDYINTEVIKEIQNL